MQPAPKCAALACVLAAALPAHALDPAAVAVVALAREACGRPPCSQDEGDFVRLRVRFLDGSPAERCEAALRLALRDEAGSTYPVHRVAVPDADEGGNGPAWLLPPLVRANAPVLCAVLGASETAEAVFAGISAPPERLTLVRADAEPAIPPPPSPRAVTPAEPAAAVQSSIQGVLPLRAEQRRAGAAYEAGFQAGAQAAEDAYAGFCWVMGTACVLPLAVLSAAAMPDAPEPRGMPTDAWRSGYRHGWEAGTSATRLRRMAIGAGILLGTVVTGFVVLNGPLRKL